MADIFLAAASKAPQTTGCKRGHLHCTPASTANHDLSSGRAHTLGLSATVWCNCSAVHGKLQMGIPARGAAVQAARWAQGRNGAQRWPRVGTAAPLHISAPPPFRSTFLRQKSRAAFQGWRRGAGEAAQFLARHGTKQLIYTRSALCFRAEPPGAARRRRERSGWRHGGQIGWLHRGASCLSARQHSAAGADPPTFLFIFPPPPPRC